MGGVARQNNPKEITLAEIRDNALERDPHAIVLYAIHDGVALLTLNRPERLNAWTDAMLGYYFDLLDKAARNPDVRAIVVTGAGRGFCSGVDMEALQALSSAGGDEGHGASSEPPRRPQTFPLSIAKPIVAAINGACAGLGLVQALMCDVRFAATGAKITTSFVRRGLVAEHGISWLLPHLVGQGAALDLLLSGRVILAEEAAEIGLVNKVLAPDGLLSFALSYANDLATNCSPAALAAVKRQVYRHMATDVETALRESNWMMAHAASRRDFSEGVRSFVEHAPPSFGQLPAELGVFPAGGPLGPSSPVTAGEAADH